MKRRSFLAAPLLATSFGAFANIIADDDQSDKKGIKVEAGKDRYNKSFNYLGAKFDLKVSGKDCNGSMSVYDTLRLEKKGPPLHSHSDLDEWFFVIEGEFKFQVGEEFMTLKAGDSLLGPRGVPHAFVKTSEGPARIIIQHTPAGTMEEFFQEAIALKDPTPEVRAALMKKHNMLQVGPALKAE